MGSGRELSSSVGELSGADLWWLRFALVRPHLAAHGATVHRELIVVRVSGPDGRVGWGECDALEEPGYTAEYTAGAWEVLRSTAIPDLLAGGSGVVAGHPMASASVVAARLDASLRASGTSLRDALGGTQPRVVSTAVCGITADLDALVGLVGSQVEAGHRSVKLKIRPGWDVAPVAAVRATWPELTVAVDANGSYGSPGAALEALRPLAELGVSYVEQPLVAADVVGAGDLAARLGVPLALDESVVDVSDLTQALRHRALSVLNVKPARVGGPLAAAALAEAAQDAGVACLCGGMLEAGLGRATSLAVASLPACGLPTDLGPSSRYLDPDIVAPIELDADGCLPVPDGPGIGVAPDESRLDELAVATWSLRL